MLLRVLALFLKRAVRAKVPRNFARVTSTDVKFMLCKITISLFSSMAQTHSRNLIIYSRSIPLDAIPSSL